MEARNYIGIVLVAIGMTLIPIGWMFSPIAAIVGWVAFVLGLIIFMTRRYLEKSEEAGFGGSSRGGSRVPTDIHDHSGWGSGGRSEGWKSSSDSGDGGGGGGD